MNNQSAHHSTFELANSRLLLRSDLTFHLQEYRGAPCYLIEDELNSRFYRIGLAEYQLISLFDGRTTISRAVALSAAQLGGEAVSEAEALTICKWLVDSQLASTSASRQSERLWESHSQSNQKKQLSRWNPISPKFPLFNPDALLSQLATSFGWLFSGPMFAVWILVLAFAGYLVGSHWDEVASSQNQVFARDNWFWLGLAWIGLKLIHELAHGLVCKRFDGEVRQAGVVLIVMIPLPYVDVTSAWRFSSKWHRIYVAGAGMYAELFLAAIAAIIWTYSDIGLVKQHAYNVMLAGSFTTLIFNANPLMRFDGYYILTDWLELPNLATHGQLLMKWIGKKFYLGLKVSKPNWPEGRGDIVAIYACLALAWKVLIYVGLAIAAESLFFGAGIVLAVVAVCTWVIWPIIKLLKFVFIGEKTQERVNRLRFCLLTSSVAILVFAFLEFVPWHAKVQAPAIVDFANLTEIRTPVGGFVRQIAVRNDQTVAAGQLLAVLENRELAADVEKLKIELEENQLRLRQLRQREEMAAFDAEQNNRSAIQKRLAERMAQLNNLQVRAEVSGIVVAEDLDSLIGAYLSAGNKLCSIGTENCKEVHALVSQHDVERFQERGGRPVQVTVWGQGPTLFPAVLDHVNPRARVELTHPALSSAVGGPLPVKFRHANEDETSDSSQNFVLLKPRFLAKVSLSSADSRRLRPGQPAVVSFRATRGSMGEVISESVADWIQNLREISRKKLR